eukprot:2657123-Rhodomonas_salina.4
MLWQAAPAAKRTCAAHIATQVRTTTVAQHPSVPSSPPCALAVTPPGAAATPAGESLTAVSESQNRHPPAMIIR